MSRHRDRRHAFAGWRLRTVSPMSDTSREPVARMSGVSKRYGAVEALREVDLLAGRGEIVALLGANGAGKTTAFEILLGLVRPSSGEAAIFGQRPGGPVRSRVGAMLQGAGLPEQGTVAELVGLVARSYRRARTVGDTLSSVGLLDRGGRTVTALSGGERQRLLLAMATVGAPELLVLDEPTAAMDVRSRRAFWEHARAAVDDGATVLFATHDLAEADDVADRVVVLQDGRLVADATPAELKRSVAAVVMHLTTDAAWEVLRRLPAVERVTALEGGQGVRSPGSRRVAIHTADPEATLVPLLLAGYRAAGLRIVDVPLEEAFWHLTTQITSTPAAGGPAS
jgi:ABC-2 type transport system ATP-binding protein